MQLEHFQNIHIRRLYWAISSPSLLAYPFCSNYFKDKQHELAVLAKLTELDSQPEVVNAHFNNLGYMPMGKYFEQLIFFILKHDNRYVLMLSNHQIKEGNRTIGELDLIVTDTQTNQREHWEIALKFYLQSNSSPNHAQMIGPNAMDNLGRKMEKLTKYQLPLSNHSTVKYLVGATKTEPKLFMKGQFFYHLANESTPPMQANPEHEKQWWCHLSEMEEMIHDDFRWCVLEKPNWIGVHRAHATSRLLAGHQLINYLNSEINLYGNPLLVAGLSLTNAGWIEQTRGFVVANNWPSITLIN